MTYDNRFGRIEMIFHLVRIILVLAFLVLFYHPAKSQGLHENDNKIGIGIDVQANLSGGFEHYGLLFAKADYGETVIDEFSSMLGIGTSNGPAKFGIGLQAISGHAKGWGIGIHAETGTKFADVWEIAGAYKTDKGAYAMDHRFGFAAKISNLIVGTEARWRLYLAGEKPLAGMKFSADIPFWRMAAGLAVVTDAGKIPSFKVRMGYYF